MVSNDRKTSVVRVSKADLPPPLWMTRGRENAVSAHQLTRNSYRNGNAIHIAGERRKSFTPISNESSSSSSFTGNETQTSKATININCPTNQLKSIPEKRTRIRGKRWGLLAALLLIIAIVGIAFGTSVLVTKNTNTHSSGISNTTISKSTIVTTQSTSTRTPTTIPVTTKTTTLSTTTTTTTRLSTSTTVTTSQTTIITSSDVETSTSSKSITVSDTTEDLESTVI